MSDYFACGICDYRGQAGRHTCPPEAVDAMWDVRRERDCPACTADVRLTTGGPVICERCEGTGTVAVSPVEPDGEHG